MKPVISNKYGSKHCLRFLNYLEQENQYSQIQVLLHFKPKFYGDCIQYS